MLSDARLRQVMTALGVEDADVERILRGEAGALQKIKAQAKKNYRRLSRRLHPDLTGNDPEKVALFRDLTTVMKEIESTQLVRPSRRQRRRGTISIRITIR